MGSVTRFEDLRVWQEGIELAVRVYEAMGTSRDFGLRDQMQRSAVSIPSNIAEGYERDSNADFIRFLGYSRGSTGELRTQLHLAKRVGHLEVAPADELIEHSRKVSAMLHKYVQTRRRDFS